MRDDYKNIVVKLWKSDGTLIAKKTVDSSGRYSFGRVRKGDIKTGPDSSKDIWFEVPLVQKFNYNSASLVTYYITFEYNGEKYEATHPDVSITLKESAPNYTMMEKEDDYGIAILTVSVSTGNTIQYIAVILIIIIMISVTIMMIIKFKNTKKIYR